MPWVGLKRVAAEERGPEEREREVTARRGYRAVISNL